jgi:hypothetical protein
VAERTDKEHRHAMVGEQVVVDGRLVEATHAARIARSAGVDGAGGEDAGEQRLPDSFSSGRWRTRHHRRTTPARRRASRGRHARGSATPCGATRVRLTDRARRARAVARGSVATTPSCPGRVRRCRPAGCRTRRSPARPAAGMTTRSQATGPRGTTRRDHAPPVL